MILKQSIDIYLFQNIYTEAHLCQSVERFQTCLVQPVSSLCIDSSKTLNPLPDNKILDLSKLKEFTDDNFRFDENGRNLSKLVENTVGTGEIALYEQFLLFPQCFQKACFLGVSKGVIVWEWVNSFPNNKF